MQEQLISRLKELLSEVGHKVNNGCGATPLSPSCAQENQNVSISEMKEEPMELLEDDEMEPSNSTSADRGCGIGPSESSSRMDTDGSDDKQITDCAAGPSCSSSPAAHGKGDTPASSSTGERGSFSEKVITVLYIRTKENKIYIIPIQLQKETRLPTRRKCRISSHSNHQYNN